MAGMANRRKTDQIQTSITREGVEDYLEHVLAEVPGGPSRTQLATLLVQFQPRWAGDPEDLKLPMRFPVGMLAWFTEFAKRFPALTQHNLVLYSSFLNDGQMYQVQLTSNKGGEPRVRVSDGTEVIMIDAAEIVVSGPYASEQREYWRKYYSPDHTKAWVCERTLSAFSTPLEHYVPVTLPHYLRTMGQVFREAFLAQYLIVQWTPALRSFWDNDAYEKAQEMRVQRQVGSELVTLMRSLRSQVEWLYRQGIGAHMSLEDRQRELVTIHTNIRREVSILLGID